jgi:pimeloyl-ACP methyl ester carboxylesterase
LSRARLFLVAAFAGVLGCSKVTVIPAGAPSLLDSFQASVADDDLSQRTLQTLRRWGLEAEYRRTPGAAYTKLQTTCAGEPEPDTLFALAEMSYLFGKQTEKASLPDACCFYYLSAGYAYHYLFDGTSESPFDPRFRLACDLYNAGLAKCIRVCQAAGKPNKPGDGPQITDYGLRQREISLPTPDGKRFVLAAQYHGFPWEPSNASVLHFCSDFQIVGLANHYRSYGLGVPLIADRPVVRTANGPLLFPNEVTFPVTALFRFEGSLADLHEHRAGCLELYNPLTIQSVSIGSRQVPLETDLTTPLAYFLARSDLQEVGYAGFLRPDQVERKSGIYTFEPYQPGKIPVLMVHGLLSSPLTWSVMFNDLRADPQLRQRFQFWFYLYPTGSPYLESAAQLRADLARLRQELDPDHQDPALDHMVLVGHSMGGLVAKLLTVDSGDGCFWNLVSREPLDRLEAKPASRAELQRIFFFGPVPGIERVVFIATPHHGSKLSPSLPGKLAADLVELPKSLRAAARDLTQENPDAGTHDLPTSVNLLAPTSPALELLAHKQPPGGVRYHSIIGQAPGNDPLREVSYVLGQTDRRTDGVVPYVSAHLDGVDSEIVVEADHNNVHRHPLAVLEVRRILLEHLKQVEGQVKLVGQVE